MTRVSLSILAATGEKPDRYRVRMLVGDGVYNGDLYPSEDIRRAAPTMTGRPVTLNHSEDDVLDVVGKVADVAWDSATKTLVGVVELLPGAPKYLQAKSLIDSMLAAGSVPNVSIEADAPKTLEVVNGERRTVRRVQQFLALSFVRVGACNDNAGCGVAARLHKEGMTVTEPDTTTTAPPAEVPAAPAKVELCAKDAALAAVKAERDDFAAKLAAKDSEIATLRARAEKAEGELVTLRTEAERAPLVAELAAKAPGFDAAKLSVTELRACLALVQSVKIDTPAAAVPAARRTALAADGGAKQTDPVTDRVAALRATMAALK